MRKLELFLSIKDQLVRVRALGESDRPNTCTATAALVLPSADTDRLGDIQILKPLYSNPI
ncbi:hypothetical protein JYQ62_12525 [Nostoc sp. UHCC 0702]|nr:hypothetical protein JYQ62_12525 [Nostoc sp. UHCC 0702]